MWLMSIILGFRRLRRQDCLKFKVSPGCGTRPYFKTSINIKNLKLFELTI